MASGHVNRANRPNTWLHRPAKRREDSPCQLGAVHTWHMVLFWGLVVGVGTGLTAVVLGAIVSTRWFSKRRGLVLGMLTASNATGQLVFLPFAAWLVQHVGWRMALIPSIAALAVAALLVVLFMRDRPADVGLLPLGDTVAPPVAPRQSAITQALGAF